ncbi:hypothetical protein N7509_004338 [Penicillium cosmopolitanum]|uniref:Glycosyltransferase family 31 protein n=1 Tax=Penicillium cosmopolitanum TaxID=1131564 RepID=A0A9W9W6T3_9EURO|nr:uncharacterized protein N7509_004338 [Penicillium cosmopolitanum]KAJ5404467.1 hypothetical protein N7509_004338 [Penicillium cosmopolitanum]
MQILSCQRSRTTILLTVFSALVFVSLLRLNHSSEHFQHNANIEITPGSLSQPQSPEPSAYPASSESQSELESSPEQPPPQNNPKPQPQHHYQTQAQAPPKNKESNLKTPQNSKEQQTLAKLENYECDIDLDLIRPYKPYDDTHVKYSRWDIAVVRTSNFKGFSPNLNVPHPDTEQPALDLDLANPGPMVQYKKLPPSSCKPIIIEAPAPEKVDASHIYVGFATTIERLHADIPAFAHWASNNNLHMFGLLEERVVEGDLGDGNGTQIFAIDRSEEIAELEKRAAELGIRLSLFTSQAEYTDRYFALTKIMYENRDRDGVRTEWAVVIDDDTFFPSMGNIVRRLREAYDSREKWYVGAPTESFEQLKMNMWMAFGGAGIFMSMPLIEEMIGSFDQCDLWKGPGDQKIAQCVYWHTKTKLTWDKGLFQLDINNDVSGFFESGRPLPLSLHHWKSNFDVDMVPLAKVAAVCGDNCLLKRWQVGDSREWFFTNGFSLVKYSAPLTDEEMNSMEFTFEEDFWKPMDDYAFTLAPLREMDWGKISFQLRDAVIENDGQRVRQIYVHEPDFFDEGRTEVREVVWNIIDEE